MRWRNDRRKWGPYLRLPAGSPSLSAPAGPAPFPASDPQSTPTRFLPSRVVTRVTGETPPAGTASEALPPNGRLAAPASERAGPTRRAEPRPGTGGGRRAGCGAGTARATRSRQPPGGADPAGSAQTRRRPSPRLSRRRPGARVEPQSAASEPAEASDPHPEPRGDMAPELLLLLGLLSGLHAR